MKLILPLMIVLSHNAAFADDAPEDICRFLGDGQDKALAELRVANCHQLVSRKLIPNSEALDYTLRYMRDNSGKLADDRCLPPKVGTERRTVTVRTKRGPVKRTVVSSAVSGEANMSRDVLRQGVKNQCQFLINDTTSTVKGFPNRGNAYWVDLCSKDAAKLVTKTYFNKGTGRGNRDVPGANTTVVGAFLTGSSTFNFVPYRMSNGYREIARMSRKQNGSSKITAVRLFGVNSSNNDTSRSKPLHVSPYRSSWGCPSTSPENAPLIEKLAQNGPSLVMNYGPSQFHKSTTSCENEPGKGTPQNRQLANTTPNRAGLR